MNDLSTAEEIRYMAQDLEDALGGVYSILAHTFQYPIVKWALKTMEKNKQINPLPDGVEPTVTTGLEALGRGHDLRKLKMFMADMGAIPPELVLKYLNVREYIKRTATAIGLDTMDLIKSEEDIAQEEAQAQQQMQQQQQMELAANSKVAGELAKAGVQAPPDQ